MTEKRGELTSTQLPLLILALVGFVILLVFMYTIFNNQSGTNDEICRVSVLTRATAPDIAQSSIPLKCTTDKICISLSGRDSECPQFAGEKAESIRLSGNPGNLADFAAMRTTIEQTLANSMYDCWKMMGTGKLDLYGSGWKSLGLASDTGKATCVICTRVALGNDVVKAGFPEKIQLGDYLKNQKVPPDYQTSYLEAFTDNQFDNYPSVQQVDSYLQSNKILKDDSVKLSGLQSGNQLAIVFAQNKPTQWDSVAKNWAYGIFGSMLSAGRISGQAGLVLGLAETGVAAYGVANAYSGQHAAVVQCRDVVASEAAVKDSGEGDRFRHGCSLIETLPYNVNDINTLCAGGVQSIP